MRIGFQFWLPLHLIKNLSLDKFILLILIVLSSRQVPPVRVQLGDITGYFLEGVNIHLPDVLHQLVNLFHLGLINDKFVAFLKIGIYVGCQVWVL